MPANGLELIKERRAIWENVFKSQIPEDFMPIIRAEDFDLSALPVATTSENKKLLWLAVVLSHPNLQFHKIMVLTDSLKISDEELFDVASIVGNLSFFNGLKSQYTDETFKAHLVTYREKILKNTATYSGDPNLFDFVHKEANSPITHSKIKDLFKLAILNGNIKLVKYFLEKYPVGLETAFSFNDLNEAKEKGYDEVVIELLAVFPNMFAYAYRYNNDRKEEKYTAVLSEAKEQIIQKGETIRALEALQTELVDKYKSDPAKLEGKTGLLSKQITNLPLTFTEYQKIKKIFKQSNPDEAYYTHPVHTAWRYLEEVNPWSVEQHKLSLENKQIIAGMYKSINQEQDPERKKAGFDYLVSTLSVLGRGSNFERSTGEFGNPLFEAPYIDSFTLGDKPSVDIKPVLEKANEKLIKILAGENIEQDLYQEGKDEEYLPLNRVIDSYYLKYHGEQTDYGLEELPDADVEEDKSKTAAP